MKSASVKFRQEITFLYSVKWFNIRHLQMNRRWSRLDRVLCYGTACVVGHAAP